MSSLSLSLGIGCLPSFYAGSSIIWEADFTDPALLTTSPETITAARAYLTSKGLTFTRASAATVQTDADSVYTGFGVDDPRIGGNGTWQGLVIEEARTNDLYPHIPPSTAADVGRWQYLTAATGTRTVNFAAAPNGAVEASRTQLAAEQHCGVAAPTLTGVTTFSAWFKRNSGGTSYQHRRSIDGTHSSIAVTGYGDTWSRVSNTTPSIATSTSTALGFDSRAMFNPSGGGASDSLSWGHQVEAGAFPTEAIITTGAAATRAIDTLAINTTSLAVGGSLGFEMEFVSKFNFNATTNDLAGSAFLAIFGNLATYFYLNKATRHINGDLGATTSTALEWSRGDNVRMWFSFGPSQPGAIKCSVNGAAASTVWTRTTPTTVTGHATAPRLLSNTSSAALSAWLRKARAYAPGKSPAWAA